MDYKRREKNSYWVQVLQQHASGEIAVALHSKVTTLQSG